MDIKVCQQCNKEYSRKMRFNLNWWKTSKFCSRECSAKSKVGKVGGMRGKKHKPETILKIRGYHHTKDAKIKISEAHLGRYFGGRRVWNDEERAEAKLKMSGSNNPRWITNRNEIKIGERSLNDPLQKQWRMSVKNRDGWKCKISNDTCFGRLEAHHILPWRDFPELRYDVNNGITLCQHHHPRKRDEVAKLSPYFQNLVTSLD